MWIVRADEEFVVSEKLYHVREHPLCGIGRNPDIALKVFTCRPFHLTGVPHVAVAVIQPVEPLNYPAAGRLDRRYPQPRKTLEYAVVHHGGKCHAGILDAVHAEKHKARTAVHIPVVPQIIAMHDEMNT